MEILYEIIVFDPLNSRADISKAMKHAVSILSNDKDSKTDNRKLEESEDLRKLLTVNILITVKIAVFLL